MWVFSEIMGLPVDDRKLLIELRPQAARQHRPRGRRRGVHLRQRLLDWPTRSCRSLSSYSRDLIEYGSRLGEATACGPARRRHDEARRSRGRGGAARRARVRRVLHPAHHGRELDDPSTRSVSACWRCWSTRTRPPVSSPTRHWPPTAAGRDPAGGSSRAPLPADGDAHMSICHGQTIRTRRQGGDLVRVGETSTRRSSSIRTASTSAARRTVTSRSGSAGLTSASVRTSRALRQLHPPRGERCRGSSSSHSSCHARTRTGRRLMPLKKFDRSRSGVPSSPIRSR